MKQELAKMNEKMTHRERQIEKREQLNEIKQYLEQNRDEYEFTVLHNYAPKVQELIDHYYDNEKKLLSVAEASKAIEIELEKYERQKAETLSKGKKAKEVYKDLFNGTTTVKKAEAAIKSDIALKTEADEPERPYAKPKPITPLPKKPVIKHQAVLGPGAQETNGSFRDPSKKNLSKTEVMQQIIKQFS